MLIYTCLIALLADVGPLDGFRANYGAISAGVDFRLEIGFAPSSLARGSNPWSMGGFGMIERQRVEYGRWEFDGKTVHLLFQKAEDSEGNVIRADPSAKVIPIYARPPGEAIFDGEVSARHTLGDSMVMVELTDRPWNMELGPFHWFESKSFLQVMDARLSKVVPRRSRSIIGPYVTEKELYSLELPRNNFYHMCIHYDPSIGYVPRFIRSVSYYALKDTGFVSELYMLDVKPCRSGGFLPAHWFVITKVVDHFKSRYASLDEISEIIPPGAKVGIARFETSNFANLKDAVGLTNLKGVKVLVGGSGSAAFSNPPQILTSAEIRSRLGRRIKPAEVRLPNIDQDALHRFDRPGTNWKTFLVPAIVILGLLLGLSYRSRKRIATWIGGFALLLSVPGCGWFGPPIIRFRADFAKDTLVYEPGASSIPVTLIIRNEGNRSISVSNIDAGCSCRRVDANGLPATLAPRSVLRLPVSIQPQAHYEPLDTLVTIDTNLGRYFAEGLLRTIPTDDFQPGTVSNTTLREQEEWTFEIVVRSVFLGAGHPPARTLDVPGGEFSMLQVSEVSGAVAALPGYRYVDRTYRLSLLGRRIGIQKTEAVLRGGDHRDILRLPILWKRSEFLSPHPERVILGPRPIRVFVSCPDDSVELTRVLQTPRGISVVIASPRELIVKLDGTFTGTISGTIEVGSSAV
jgi:hypothetical protein